MTQREQMIMALENLLVRVKQETPMKYNHRHFDGQDCADFAWLYPDNDGRATTGFETHIFQFTWLNTEGV